MVRRSQTVHFAVQEHDAVERERSAETALKDIRETHMIMLIATHNVFAGIIDGIDHRRIPSSNDHDFDSQVRHPADRGWRQRRWW